LVPWVWTFYDPYEQQQDDGWGGGFCDEFLDNLHDWSERIQGSESGQRVDDAASRNSEDSVDEKDTFYIEDDDDSQGSSSGSPKVQKLLHRLP